MFNLFCRFCSWLPYAKKWDAIQNNDNEIIKSSVISSSLGRVWIRTQMFEVSTKSLLIIISLLFRKWEEQEMKSPLVVWAENKFQAHIAGSWQPLLAEWAQAVQAVPYFVRPQWGTAVLPGCPPPPRSCDYLKRFESLTGKTIQCKVLSQRLCCIWSSPKYRI